MLSPRSRLRIFEIISGGKLLGLIEDGEWRHVVAMVTQNLVKYTPFETFIFLWHTTNV